MKHDQGHLRRGMHPVCHQHDSAVDRDDPEDVEVGPLSALSGRPGSRRQSVARSLGGCLLIAGAEYQI